MELIQLASLIGLPAIAGLTWLLRLEGRVNGHDRELGDVKDDIRYIRQRIDSALNGRGRS